VIKGFFKNSKIKSQKISINFFIRRSALKKNTIFYLVASIFISQFYGCKETHYLTKKETRFIKGKVTNLVADSLSTDKAFFVHFEVGSCHFDMNGNLNLNWLACKETWLAKLRDASDWGLEVEIAFCHRLPARPVALKIRSNIVFAGIADKRGSGCIILTAAPFNIEIEDNWPKAVQYNGSIEKYFEERVYPQS